MPERIIESDHRTLDACDAFVRRVTPLLAYSNGVNSISPNATMVSRYIVYFINHIESFQRLNTRASTSEREAITRAVDESDRGGCNRFQLNGCLNNMRTQHNIRVCMMHYMEWH